MDLPVVNLPASEQIFGTLFVLIGAGLVAVAVRLYFKQRGFLRDAASAQGTVVDLTNAPSESIGSGGRTEVQYFSSPRVKFRTASGEEVTFESSLGSSTPSFRAGDTVRVRYLPERPAEAEIDGFWENWFGTIAAGACGGVLLTVGLGSVILSGREIPPHVVGAILAFISALVFGLAGYLYLRRRKQSRSANTPDNMVRAFGLSLWLPGVVLAFVGCVFLGLALGFLRDLL